MIIAGIGSRSAPTLALEQAQWYGRILSAAGFTIRSGGANGMDKAFETGARKVKDSYVEVLTARGVIPERAFEIAMEHHPAWVSCNPYAKRLLARNAQIILGRDLDDPADLVLYWTSPTADPKRGGTNHSLRIARAHGVSAMRVDDPHTVDYTLDLIRDYIKEFFDE